MIAGVVASQASNFVVSVLAFADGLAAGTSVATGVGASEVAAAGSSAGIGAAIAAGAQTAAATGAAYGVGAASAVYEPADQGDGAASGVGSVSAVGAATVAGAGSAAGVGAASGASPAWSDTFAQALNADSNTWNATTLRQWFAAAVITTSGSRVRVTIEGATTEGAQIDAMYLGHAAGSGDAYDFDGTQVQLLASGSGTFTVGANAMLVLDPVTYALDETKNLVIAVHFNNSSADNVRGRTGLGANFNAYFKTASNEASTTNATTGYTAGSGNLRLINRIEVV